MPEILLSAPPARPPVGSSDFVLVGPGTLDLWPVVKMTDGSLRKGPYAEIVGRV